MFDMAERPWVGRQRRLMDLSMIEGLKIN